MSWITERWRPIDLGLLAGGVAVVAASLLFMPSETGGHGTRLEVLFPGVVIGLVTGLNAAAVILVYRTLRVLNFAQTFLGGAGAVLTFELVLLTPVPFPVALVLGLLGGALVGIAFDLIFGRRFARAPRLVLSIFTIIAGEFMVKRAVDLVARLPFFPPIEQRVGTPELASGDLLRARLPFHDLQFFMPGSKIPFGFPHLMAIALVVVSLGGLALFLNRTRAGVAVRAMAENPERAALLGINVAMLGTLVWAISGALSAASVLMVGALGTPALALTLDPQLLEISFAAALLGRMRSVPVAVLAAVGMTTVTQSLAYNLPNRLTLLSVVTFGIITVALLVQGKQLERSEQGAGGGWQAAEEVRPVPREMAGLIGLRIAKYAFVLLVIAAAAVYPLVSTIAQTNLAGVLALYGIAALSIVVITGWSGQASLGQFGLVAIGAVVAGALSTRLNLPFWLAVPAATALTGGVSALLALPALRIKGLFLLISSAAFAVMVHDFLFDATYFGWLLPGPIRRPSLFLLDFDNERNMYYLCLASLVLAAVVVVNLRRSRFGRLVIAVRENEANAQSAAVSAVRIKILAFAVAGCLAGFAGAVFAFHQRGVSADNFDVLASIGIFTQVVVGGAASLVGALMGVGYFNISFRLFSGDPLLTDLLVTSAALYILYISPGGMMALAVKARDAVLRIIAQRNQMIVPSLFADIDPGALHQRLVPLGTPLTSTSGGATRDQYAITASRYHRLHSARSAGVSGESNVIGAAALASDEALPAEARA
ncbi:MAG: hypothetical protein ABR598_02305 [Candidatus Dormibacteria bacterium]